MTRESNWTKATAAAPLHCPACGEENRPGAQPMLERQTSGKVICLVCSYVFLPKDPP